MIGKVRRFQKGSFGGLTTLLAAQQFAHATGFSGGIDVVAPRFRRLSPRRVHRRAGRASRGRDRRVARASTEEFVRNAARVAANDDIYDLEDTHSAAEPRVRRHQDAASAPSGLFPRQPAPKVVAILKDLWGSVRFDTGKLNMKSAGYGAPVEWHQDWAFYPHTNDDLAAVGIMLDDCRHGERPDDGDARAAITGRSTTITGPTAGSAARWTRTPAASTCRGGAVPRQGRLDHGASCPRGARLGDQFLRQASGASCCTNTAPPMPGRCSASRTASRSSTSCCWPASRPWRRASPRCRCACRCRRPSTRARSTRTSAPPAGGSSRPRRNGKGYQRGLAAAE